MIRSNSGQAFNDNNGAQDEVFAECVVSRVRRRWDVRGRRLSVRLRKEDMMPVPSHLRGFVLPLDGVIDEEALSAGSAVHAAFGCFD